MKRSRILTGFLLLLALGVGTVLSAVIRGKPTAQSNGSSITVHWESLDETGVQRYEVLRRSGGSLDYVLIGTVAELKGNNSAYEFVDNNVFKTTDGVYRYKIRVINGQNPAPESEPTDPVSHFTSAAKRTWGSIKAMFR